MQPEAYEILALLMRYVFVLIGLLIVWRSFRWLLRDARAYQREMRALPDAGLVGEMVNLLTGEAYPLPHEGVIGSGRNCDIRIKGGSVSRRHARFEFVEGKGLKILPIRRGAVLLGGVPVHGAGYALHGTQLGIGDALLRVRMFAGLNVPHPAAYAEPDAVLEAGVYLEPWQDGDENGEALPAYPDFTGNGEADYIPYSTGAIPPGAPLEGREQAEFYDGGYTEDGQMTWQYAYSLDELRNETDKTQWNQMQPSQGAPDEEEGIPYQSPVPRRRRRDRHGR